MECFDLAFRQATIIDGTGNHLYKADVGISGDKISYIGKIFEDQTDVWIDAAGKMLAPGFIDIHAHSDLYVFYDPSLHRKLAQGVTTEVSGNCGMSAAPVSKRFFEEKKQYFQGINIGIKPPENWKEFETFEVYLDEVEKIQPGTNMAFLLGHGDVRIAVMGFEDRKATAQEMESMKKLTVEAMRNGAVGISTGLIYAPGMYTDKEEIHELCRVVAEYGGIYTTHIRSELSNITDSVSEAIEVGEKVGIPVVISHHKIGGKENWGQSEETLQLIDEANHRGVKVSMDVYPYTASCTYLNINIPPACHAEGTEKMLETLADDHRWEQVKKDISKGVNGWECAAKKIGYDNILIIASDHTPEATGKTLAEIAERRKEDPLNTLRWMILANRGNVMAANFAFDEKDMINIMRHPYAMIGSDGLQTGQGKKTHPRATATFPRLLAKYVREKEILSWEEAIRKITSLPAQIVGLKGKGLIKEGYDADLVLFDPKTIADQATYEDPYAQNIGIEMVLVNGHIALEKGVIGEKRYGKVLKHGIF